MLYYLCMKKMVSCLSIVFIMIVCTLVAGCITPNVDTPLGNNNVVTPGTVDNTAQKEFDHYMAIYNSKPSDYKIVSDENVQNTANKIINILKAEIE